jgi:hypothetical protein
MNETDSEGWLKGSLKASYEPLLVTVQVVRRE